MGIESPADVGELGGTTDEEKSVDEIFAGEARKVDLVLDVLHNLLHACPDDVVEVALLIGAVAIAQGDDLVGVVVGVLYVGIAIGALEGFGFALLAVEDVGDVAGDVGSSQGDDGQMAQEFALVDGHRGGFTAHVDKHAARGALLFGGDHRGQLGGGQSGALDGQSGFAEARFDGLHRGGVAGDIEELCVNAFGHHAQRFGGDDGAEFILEGDGLQIEAVGSFLLTVEHEEVVEQLLGDGEAFVILLVDAVDDGARGLAIDGHVEPADAAIDLLLQPLTDGFEVGGHFLDIEHAPLVDEVDRGNGDIGEHIDDAFGLFAPHDARHFGRTEHNGSHKAVGVLFCHI